MTKDELLKKLTECQSNGDPEVAHDEADKALLEYINDKKITEAYEKIERWYA
ncbi:MAG: hypothetical protein WC364_13970 [Eubacteriales bacterium]|jgi:hypothetical protein